MHPVPAGTRARAVDASTGAAAALPPSAQRAPGLRRLPPHAHPGRAPLPVHPTPAPGASCFPALRRLSQYHACVSHSVLSDSAPWPVARQAPPSMGLSRRECWSALPLPAPGDPPNPGTEPGSPASQADSFLSQPPETTQ